MRDSGQWQKVVLYRLSDELSDDQREEFLVRIRGLKDVPGVTSVTCGKHGSGNSQGYTHAALVRFESEEALNGYAPHPAHLHVGELIKSYGIQTLPFNFEITTLNDWASSSSVTSET